MDAQQYRTQVLPSTRGGSFAGRPQPSTQTDQAAAQNSFQRLPSDNVGMLECALPDRKTDCVTACILSTDISHELTRASLKTSKQSCGSPTKGCPLTNCTRACRKGPSLQNFTAILRAQPRCASLVLRHCVSALTAHCLAFASSRC